MRSTRVTLSCSLGPAVVGGAVDRDVDRRLVVVVARLPVHLDLVVAGAAVDDIVGLLGPVVGAELVAAVAAAHDVRALVAEDFVVARPAVDGFSGVAALDPVVAGAAEQLRGRQKIADTATA